MPKRHHPPRERKPRKPRPPKPSPPPSPPVGNDERSRFLDCLRSQIGKPYVWGTHGPNSFDCSGLVCFCYRKATGRDIAGGCGSQLQMQEAGRRLRSNEEWQSGDLLFYLGGEHVGVYTGNGKAIHAMNPSQGVIETSTSSPYWNSNFVMARRLWET